MDTTVCIAGGGPAGAMLGLLLARSGIDVVVLEKHGDFLRDFRGDTIHPSTLEVLDEIGLAERFARLEHQKVTQLVAVTDDGELTLAAIGRLKLRHPYIALVPQWDFLDMLTEEAARYPSFHLIMNATASGLLRDGDRVTGLRYRDADGGEHEIRALLTVGADGRHSDVRRAAGLRSKEYGSPMDIAWFAIPRVEGDRDDWFLRLTAGRMMVAINRRTYWQLGYIVPKGGYDRVRREGVEALRSDVAELMPVMADRLAGLDMADVGLLNVRIDRLRRWYRPGLLCIGDAAHAMSPVGGVGINLAIQDAVATANLLYEPLRRGVVEPSDLAAVQRRRSMPTRVVQGMQRIIQAGIVRPTLRGGPSLLSAAASRFRPSPPALAAARMIALGPRPEHVRIPAAAALPTGSTEADSERVAEWVRDRPA